MIIVNNNSYNLNAFNIIEECIDIDMNSFLEDAISLLEEDNSLATIYDVKGSYEKDSKEKKNGKFKEILKKISESLSAFKKKIIEIWDSFSKLIGKVIGTNSKEFAEFYGPKFKKNSAGATFQAGMISPILFSLDGIMQLSARLNYVENTFKDIISNDSHMKDDISVRDFKNEYYFDFTGNIKSSKIPFSIQALIDFSTTLALSPDQAIPASMVYSAVFNTDDYIKNIRSNKENCIRLIDSIDRYSGAKPTDDEDARWVRNYRNGIAAAQEFVVTLSNAIMRIMKTNCRAYRSFFLKFVTGAYKVERGHKHESVELDAYDHEYCYALEM